MTTVITNGSTLVFKHNFGEQFYHRLLFCPKATYSDGENLSVFGSAKTPFPDGQYLTFSVTGFKVNFPRNKIKISVTNRGITKSDVLSFNNSTSKPMFRFYDVSGTRQVLSGDTNIQITFEAGGDDPTKQTAPISSVIRGVIESGPKITLNGSNGDVSVPKALFVTKSKAFEAMFDHDTEENRTSTVDMKDFDEVTLQSFSNYIWSENFCGDKNSALGMYILADKYDIHPLRKEAEDFVVANLRDFDKDEVFGVFLKIGMEKIKDMFFRFHDH